MHFCAVEHGASKATPSDKIKSCTHTHTHPHAGKAVLVSAYTDHTHRSKKKKEAFNGPIHLRVKGLLRKVERLTGGSTQRFSAARSWMSLHMTHV